MVTSLMSKLVPSVHTARATDDLQSKWVGRNWGWGILLAGFPRPSLYFLAINHSGSCVLRNFRAHGAGEWGFGPGEELRGRGEQITLIHIAGLKRFSRTKGQGNNPNVR